MTAIAPPSPSLAQYPEARQHFDAARIIDAPRQATRGL